LIKCQCASQRNDCWLPERNLPAWLEYVRLRG
jgi:hypothetical protein